MRRPAWDSSFNRQWRRSGRFCGRSNFLGPVYWVVLLVGMPVAVSLDAAVWLLLVAFAAAVWLAMSVAEAAAATGGAPGVWGAGTFFLGPFGSLFFPWYQLYRLRASM
jgi:hypothetical protein